MHHELISGSQSLVTRHKPHITGRCRGQGMTIGIISHVPVLQQRISTQIVVEKQAGGNSSLRVVAS